MLKTLVLRFLLSLAISNTFKTCMLNINQELCLLLIVKRQFHMVTRCTHVICSLIFFYYCQMNCQRICQLGLLYILLYKQQNKQEEKNKTKKEKRFLSLYFPNFCYLTFFTQYQSSHPWPIPLPPLLRSHPNLF